jgi:glutamate racemase
MQQKLVASLLGLDIDVEQVVIASRRTRALESGRA